MRDKDQQLMYSKAELATLKAVFADNEELLYAVRAVLQGFPEASDWALVRSQITPETLALVKRRMLGNIGSHVPLSQLGDLPQTLTSELKVKTVEEMQPLFEAKQLEMDYLEQQFAVLAGEETEATIHLSDLAKITDDAHANYVNTTARNYLLAFIDQNILFIKSLAGSKEESEEAQLKRLTRDSSE